MGKQPGSGLELIMSTSINPANRQCRPVATLPGHTLVSVGSFPTSTAQLGLSRPPQLSDRTDQSRSALPCPPMLCSCLAVKGIANTGVVHWGGKLLALYEVGGWY